MGHIYEFFRRQHYGTRRHWAQSQWQLQYMNFNKILRFFYPIRNSPALHVTGTVFTNWVGKVCLKGLPQKIINAGKW
jgi:hypothetical protein